ncbi:alpha/beta hydrolase [Variovorax sp. J22R133]|uniref:alpha/beta fold hydrolase n=1 Tax=Variovorax brevis TaxID=3053503 RepID=UPI002577D5FB|nr:alpha/beta hydrolase [Variovorax sp. J22R133]MDM0117326.1 alpha/beta hydrolase [Variovorax sp. J22R133]
MNREAQDQIDHLATLASREAVEWEGRQVTWRRFGSGGRPLVMLHGGHGNWMHWSRNVEALGVDRAVWVPDMPGYGDSDDAEFAGSLAAVVRPTMSTLDRLVGEGSPVDLAGFSFGGLVAAFIAARRPAVERLALLGPAGHAGHRRPRGTLRSWKQAAEAGDAAALDAIMRHNLSVHMLHMEADDIDALAVRIHTDACLHTRFRSRDISQSGGLFEALARRSAPTLLLWGEHDVTADPPALVKTVADKVPHQAQARIVEGAGHWVQYERADVVNKILSDWFS